MQRDAPPAAGLGPAPIHIAAGDAATRRKGREPAVARGLRAANPPRGTRLPAFGAGLLPAAATGAVLEDVLRAALDVTGAGMDGARAGAWRVDFLANAVIMDERTRALLGVNETDLRPFDLDFVHAEDRAGVRARLAAMASRGNDTWNAKFRVVHADGQVVTLRSIGRAERDSAGRLLSISGITQDVTAERKAEELVLQARVKEEEAMRTIRQMFAAATQGILTATQEGVIETSNAALQAMFGYAAGELDGRPIEGLIPGALRVRTAPPRPAMEDGSGFAPIERDVSLAGRRRDGTTFPVEMTWTEVPTARGGRILAFVTDMTDRKRAERELLASHVRLQGQADQLRQRTRQLQRLASQVTLAEQNARAQLARRLHDDLQQILFSAKLRVERVLGSRGRPAAAAAVLDQARGDLDHAIQVTRSLSHELVPAELHVAGLAVAVSWLAAWMAEKYGLTVEVSADPRAELDESGLRTLAFESIRELLFDVVKHARVARATVDLTVAPEDRVRIVVADRGVGFDPGVVLSSVNEGLSGFGLFSIRERAALLGGSLRIESAPGEGTRFTLLLPRTSTERAAAADSAAALGAMANDGAATAQPAWNLQPGHALAAAQERPAGRAAEAGAWRGRG